MVILSPAFPLWVTSPQQMGAPRCLRIRHGAPNFVSGERFSGKDAVDDVAVHVRQAPVDAAVTDGEFFVIDA